MGVSVVIPAYNMASTLRAAVESAVWQADEVLVVNDGSTDDFAGALRGLTRKHDNLRVLHTHARAGVCYARNFGIRFAKHDLIFPLDADDSIYSDTHLALMEAVCYPGQAVYGGWIEQDMTNNRREEIEAPPPGMLWRKPITRGLLFHRDDWERAGQYNPDYNLGAEDWAFALALAKVGVEFIRIEGPVIIYNLTNTGRGFACRRRWPLIEAQIQEDYGDVIRGYRAGEYARTQPT